MSNEDRHAEAVIAGCAAASRHGAELAHQRLTADQFTSEAMRAVFTAAAEAPSFLMPTDAQATAWALAHAAGQHPATIWPSELRLHHIADAAHVPLEQLQRLVDIRPVDTDTTGLYARRVAAAAERRRLEHNVVELHELVRVGDERRARDLAEQILTTLGAAS
jgi:replicative DNA helicase